MIDSIFLVIISGLLGYRILQSSKTVSPNPVESPEIDPDIFEVPYGFIFARIAKKYNVPVRLMVATVDYESNFNPKAVNPETKADEIRGRNVDSVGLGQILYPDTSDALASKYGLGKISKEDLYNPEINLNLVGLLYRELLQRFKKKDALGFHAEAVAAYNAGTVKRNDDGTFKNQTYVDRVRKKWIAWRSLES